MIRRSRRCRSRAHVLVLRVLRMRVVGVRSGDLRGFGAVAVAAEDLFGGDFGGVAEEGRVV